MLQTIAGGALVVLAGLSLVLGFLWLVRRRWSPARLRSNNDVASAYANVIGTTYAVILAFMLSGVWVNYNDAIANTEQEADALIDLYRLAGGVAVHHGQQVRDLAHVYVRVMLDVEWPAMTRGSMAQEGRVAHDRLWRAVLAIHPGTPAEQAVFSQMLSDLSNVTRHRALREFQVRLGLPAILWCVLVSGWVITVGVFSFFGVEEWRLHVIKSCALTLLISIILVAIGEVDQPFQGRVHVEPVAFRLAHATIDRLRAAEGDRR